MLNTAAYVLKKEDAGSLVNRDSKEEDPKGALLDLLRQLGLA